MGSFTLDSIRCKTANENVFSMGKSMAEDNLVTLDGVKSFGRSDTEVKGIIKNEGGENGIETKLLVSDGSISSHQCSSCNTKFTLCVHEAATAFAYYRYLYQNTAMKTSTSKFMKDIMDANVKNGIFDMMRDSYGSASIVPKLNFTDTTFKITFKIRCEDKEFVISDLVEFYNRIKSEEVAGYGKSFMFKHTIWAFDKETRPLLLLLLQAVEEEISIYAENNPNRSKDNFKLRELKLERSYVEDIFKLVSSGTDIIEVEFGDKFKKNYFMVWSNPKLTMHIKETLLGGYRIEPGEEIRAFAGLKHLYVFMGDYLYICDGEYTKNMREILPKMSFEAYKEDNFSVSKRDMPVFYEQMIKNLRRFVEIDDGTYVCEESANSHLEVNFHFDLDEAGNVVCEETFSYGDFSYNPFKGGSVPVGILRDYPGEYKIKSIVDNYFKQPANEEGKLIVSRESEIFRLLDEGLPMFMELGNVYIADNFKNVKVIAAPKAYIGARTSSGMLEIDFNIDNFDKDELKGLLESYRQRKKYYRLKNGEFVRLEENSLAVITELTDSLNLSDKDIDKLFAGELAVPKYRALYLESLIEQGSDIRFERDKNLRQLIRSMKEMADSDYEVPDSLKHTLRKYQRTGYRWLRTLAQNGFGGILADDMGLGKTLQIITFLLACKEKSDETMSKPALIVCPASLVYNWDNEIRRFAPGFSTVVVSGSAQERKELIESAADKEIFITSYDSLRRDMDFYREMEFSYQVIDEAQFIKNPATQNAKSVKEIKADVKFALTGTPIENRLSELWSIFDYLMPGFLYSYAVFRNEIENPIVKDEDRVALIRLQNMIKPFVLRRLKSDVLKDLPEKQEAVVYSKLSGEQLKLYAANVTQFKNEIMGLSAAEFATKRMHVLAQLMRLRQICCDPALCYENYKEASAKLDTCMELVRGAVESGHKILLFSQFTSMLERIAGAFDAEGISYFTLTGDTPKQTRVKLAEEFNNDDTKVFLISLKAGGTGLNLTGADIVIHYDPWWNVAVQNQATDRAHRIGQKNKVNVYKLIVKDSIEEKILKLQESKEMLAESVVSEEVAKLTSLSKEELLKLLD